MKINLKIKKYLDIEFIKIINNNIIINPKIIECFSDFSSQERLINEIRFNFYKAKLKLKYPSIILDLVLICLNNEIVTTDDYMEEFYYHSSLLDRLKNGALDDQIMKGSSIYYEILGILFTIPIYINPEINTVNYGADKIEIPKRKTRIENELDAEFARGIMLYQLLNETLKEDKEDLKRHLLFTGYLTALKHWFKISDGKFQFTAESLQNMTKEYENRDTKEDDIIKDSNDN